MMLLTEIHAGVFADSTGHTSFSAAVMNSTQGLFIAGFLLVVSVAMFLLARRLSHKPAAAAPEALAVSAHVAEAPPVTKTPQSRPETDARTRERRADAPSVHTWAPKTGAFGIGAGERVVAVYADSPMTRAFVYNSGQFTPASGSGRKGEGSPAR